MLDENPSHVFLFHQIFNNLITAHTEYMNLLVHFFISGNGLINKIDFINVCESLVVYFWMHDCASILQKIDLN